MPLPKQIKKAAKIIALLGLAFVIIAILLLTALYLWNLWELCGPNPKIHKYVMPGNYTTYLPRGQYGGWIFTRWATKQVNSSSDSTMDVSISGTADGFAKGEKFKSDELQVSYSDRVGRLDFFFEVTKPGLYRISSKTTQRLIFVIVPEDQRYFDLGNDCTFAGAGGDFNFELGRR